jgi:hypothetical protein
VSRKPGKYNLLVEYMAGLNKISTLLTKAEREKICRVENSRLCYIFAKTKA